MYKVFRIDITSDLNTALEDTSHLQSLDVLQEKFSIIKEQYKLEVKYYFVNNIPIWFLHPTLKIPGIDKKYPREICFGIQRTHPLFNFAIALDVLAFYSCDNIRERDLNILNMIGIDQFLTSLS